MGSLAASREVRVTLPPLHAAQRLIAQHPARLKILSCGRRWGKTRLGTALGLETALRGGRVFWVAPTYAQSSIAWRLVRPMAVQIPGAQAREADRVVLFSTGGEFWFKSSDQPDNLRGEGLDLLIMDEADYQDGRVWDEVLRPALADRKGRAVFISTPNLEGGWFHQLFLRGMSGEDPGCASWQLPSWTNPFLDPAEIDAARATMPSIVFRREFGAEFVSASGARIQRAWLKHGTPPRGATVVVGVDLAISEKTSADWTACVALASDFETGWYVVDADRVRAPFHQVLRFIEQFSSAHSPAVVAIEKVQYQAAVVQELLRTTTLPVKGVVPDRDKITRFQPLEARYEQGLIWHARTLPREFEAELLSFPVGEHDDFADALSTAFSAFAVDRGPVPDAPEHVDLSNWTGYDADDEHPRGF